MSAVAPSPLSSRTFLSSVEKANVVNDVISFVCFVFCCPITRLSGFGACVSLTLAGAIDDRRRPSFAEKGDAKKDVDKIRRNADHMASQVRARFLFFFFFVVVSVCVCVCCFLRRFRRFDKTPTVCRLSQRKTQTNLKRKPAVDSPSKDQTKQKKTEIENRRFRFFCRDRKTASVPSLGSVGFRFLVFFLFVILF